MSIYYLLDARDTTWSQMIFMLWGSGLSGRDRHSIFKILSEVLWKGSLEGITGAPTLRSWGSHFIDTSSWDLEDEQGLARQRVGDQYSICRGRAWSTRWGYYQKGQEAGPWACSEIVRMYLESPSCLDLPRFWRTPGSANHRPQIKYVPTPVFVNKVLLKRSLARLFTIHCPWLICAAKAEGNGCDRDCMTCKAKVFTI